MSTTRRATRRFRVGDWVSFIFGPQRVWGQVIEDVGPLGVNGRRLYRIRMELTSEETREFPMPEDDLQSAGPPDKDAVLEFLKGGGLVAILQSHLVKNEKSPRAWLTFNRRGKLVSTLDPARGALGGAPVPYFALFEDKIFKGKKEEVIDLLAGFGLSRAEAQDVIHAVGTGP